MRNVSFTWRKSTRINEANVDIADIAVSDERQADAAAIESSERKRIINAIESLPDEFREIVVLREVEELSYKEISSIVGAPIGTVMSRLARARRRLAVLLGDQIKEVG